MHYSYLAYPYKRPGSVRMSGDRQAYFRDCIANALGGTMMILTADYATYTAKDYTINTNPWGKGNLVNGVDYTDSISFDPKTFPNGINFLWSFPSSSSVWAYPEIKYTPQSGTSQIGNFANLSMNYSITLSGDTSQYDVALDLWLTPQPGGKPTQELMIFFHTPPMWDFVALQWKGVQPYTITDSTLTNAGVWIEANHGQTAASPGWTIIEVQSPIDLLTGTLSISDVIKTLIWQGVITGNEYLADVQFGAEIAGGTGGLNINNLSYNWNANPSLVGTSGNDTFVITSMGGNNVVGNGGVDTAIYSGLYSDYQIKQFGSATLVTKGNNISTLDELQGVRFIQFSNGTYDVVQSLFSLADLIDPR
jgi:hypothetical protein